MTVHIYRGVGPRNWRVRLVGDNGRILSISEGYASKWGARRAAKKFYPDVQIIEVKK